MAIQLEANYSKKLGLPQYSSHQFSLTIKKELSDVKEVEAESARLYSLLQSCVDQEIQETGFLPGPQQEVTINRINGNGHSNGNGNNGHDEEWKCSPKQRDLILKIVNENNLDKREVDALAHNRFSKGVRHLNKLEASGFIEELLEQYGNKDKAGNGRRFTRAGAK